MCSEIQSRVDEDTIQSQLIIPSLHPADRGLYTCTANNFLGNSSTSVLLDVKSPEGSVSHSSGFLLPSLRKMFTLISVLSSRQSMASQSSGMLWQTIQLKPGSLSILADMTHSRRSRYILGRVLTHTFTDLLPVTKYEICVTLKNQVPRNGQCIVFVTGSDFNEMQQREKLIHIVIIVLAMVLAVPAGMYACTTDAKFNCFERCTEMWRNRRHLESSHTSDERNGTFDSLQAASDEGLFKESSKEQKARRRSAEKIQKLKNERRPTAELYWHHTQRQQ